MSNYELRISSLSKAGLVLVLNELSSLVASLFVIHYPTFVIDKHSKDGAFSTHHS